MQKSWQTLIELFFFYFYWKGFNFMKNMIKMKNHLDETIYKDFKHDSWHNRRETTNWK